MSLGLRPDGALQQIVLGDSIFNAADDNASGSAGILAVAEQMMRTPRPRRSVMFIWDTGHEIGLYGSRSFVAKKVVPTDSIVTHINVDMAVAWEISNAPQRPVVDKGFPSRVPLR